MSDEIRPALFDRDADPERWSNVEVGGKRLTWRELAQHQQDQLRRLSARSTILEDLDRCEHGRHEGDVCDGCGGPSRGNPCMIALDQRPIRAARQGFGGELVDRQIGYSIHRSPIVVPERGEPWAGTTDEPIVGEPETLSFEEMDEIGVVQETNRRLLHPVGLALARATDGTLRIYTDPDPEGWNFGDLDLAPRAAAFAAREEEWHDRRRAALGYVVQPIQ